MAKTYHVGYEELKKLVVKVAVQSGMAAPATKPRQTIRQETPKEDGHIRSQKILLTWLIDREELFDQVSRYVTPEDLRWSCTGKLLNFCMNSMQKEN